MTKSAGGVRARAAVTALDRAQVPTPELLPPAPAKESTVQRDSWSRLSTGASRLDWLAHGVIGLVVAAIVRTGEVRRATAEAARAGVPLARQQSLSWWLGLGLVVGGVLWFEHEWIAGVWPALMHGHSLWEALLAAGLLPVLVEAEDTDRCPICGGEHDRISRDDCPVYVAERDHRASCGVIGCPNLAVLCSWPRECGTFTALCAEHAHLTQAAHLLAVERLEAGS